ncbi:hypothetical protein RchiOBHm_Chr7g0242811 [Rosa chinensis]|uniref:Uncharacterized protein n=1 Tax=Rosa chinensis TaxID=74649 RepID=A0A2P6PIK7_ROSCH|nr:hypothetical protein RchiOBHm_Chr7g0242811 [Rosa chinensis]
MPYNPGKHWILTILWEGEIYMLDPLPKPVHYQVWETSLINVVKTFNAETGMVNKLPKVKSLPVRLIHVFGLDNTLDLICQCLSN